MCLNHLIPTGTAERVIRIGLIKNTTDELKRMQEEKSIQEIQQKTGKKQKQKHRTNRKQKMHILPYSSPIATMILDAMILIYQLKDNE